MTTTHPDIVTDDEVIALRQEWGTPPDLFAALDREFHFDIDVCASDENKKCDVWIDQESDALSKSVPWLGDEDTGVRAAFCNPGFSKPFPWIKKAHSEALQHDGVVVVVGLTSNSADWWWYVAQHATEIRLLRPRPQFVIHPRLAAHLRAKGLPVSSSNARENSVFIFTPRTPKGGARIWTWEWKKEAT